MDTNVVVAGLLTGRLESPTCRILDGMLAMRFPFLLSIDLLAEYRAVLQREPIRKRHGLSRRDLETILTELAANAIFRVTPETAPVGLPTPDLGDLHLIRLLTLDPRASLVTGDLKLQRALRNRWTAHSPAEFVELQSL